MNFLIGYIVGTAIAYLSVAIIIVLIKAYKRIKE